VLLFIVLISVISGVFFYCQALMSGLGRKRWAVAGCLFGPLVWPMFQMKKRMKIVQLFGWSCLILRA